MVETLSWSNHPVLYYPVLTTADLRTLSKGESTRLKTVHEQAVPVEIKVFLG